MLEIFQWKDKYFNVNQSLKENDWRDIHDFLKSDEGKILIPELENINLTKMNKLVQKWHENLNKRKCQNEIENIDYFTVRQFDDGFSWVILNSQLAYNNEGLLMSHCAPNYFKNKSASSIIFSLRNKESIPKITIEYDYLKNAITQIQSKRNNIVSRKYREYLVTFLNSIESTSIKDIIFKMHRIMVVQSKHFSYKNHNRHGLFINKDNKFDYIKPNQILSGKDIVYSETMSFFSELACDSFSIDAKLLPALEFSKLETQTLTITNYDKNSSSIPLNWIFSHLITPETQMPNLRISPPPRYYLERHSNIYYDIIYTQGLINFSKKEVEPINVKAHNKISEQNPNQLLKKIYNKKELSKSRFGLFTNNASISFNSL